MIDGNNVQKSYLHSLIVIVQIICVPVLSVLTITKIVSRGNWTEPYVVFCSVIFLTAALHTYVHWKMALKPRFIGILGVYIVEAILAFLLLISAFSY